MGPPGRVRQEAGNVSVLEPAQSGPVEVLLDADGHHFYPAGIVGAWIGQQAHFGCAEGHRQVRGEHGSRHRAGIGVNAAGQIARNHKDLGAGFRDGTDQIRGAPPQAAFRTRSQHCIDHDVGARGLCGQATKCGVTQVPDTAAGPLKSSQSLGMGGV